MRTGEGQVMSVEDVKGYVCWKKQECKEWSFDDITGGIDEFENKKEYTELKKWFEKNIDNEKDL